MDSKSPLIGKWRKYWCDQITIRPDKQFCCEYTETEFTEEFDFPDIFSGHIIVRKMKMLGEDIHGKVSHLTLWNDATYEIDDEILSVTDCGFWKIKLNIEEFDFPEVFTERPIIRIMRMPCEHFPGKVRHILPYDRSRWNEATYEVNDDILTLIDCRGYTFKLRRVIPESQEMLS